MPSDKKFRKAERLCSKKIIEELFLSGKSFYKYPFRLVWMPVSDKFSFPAQVAVSVKKKQFKRAVDRNLLKRRIREAYRKNKSDLYSEIKRLDMQIALIIIYTASDIMEYNDIEAKIILNLDRLKMELGDSKE